MKRNHKLLTGLTATTMVLAAFILVWGIYDANTSGSVPKYYDNPLVGSYSFIKGAHGFLAANGFAYSYVRLDTSLATNGSTFTMRPALNIQVPSPSNFSAIVTYGGSGPKGMAFDIFLPVLGSYITLSSNAWAFTPDAQSTIPGGALHVAVRGTSTITLFVYVGPTTMPTPPDIS